MSLNLTSTDRVMSLGRWVVQLIADGADGARIAADTGVTPGEAMFAVGLYVGRIIVGQPEPPSQDCRLGFDGWCTVHKVFHPEPPTV